MIESCMGCRHIRSSSLKLPCVNCGDNFNFYEKAEEPEIEFALMPGWEDQMGLGLNENISKPKHYTFGKIEVWNAIEDWKLDYFSGCAVKYIARAGRKDKAKEIEDLQKAVAYLNKKIKRLENEQREQK